MSVPDIAYIHTGQRTAQPMSVPDITQHNLRNISTGHCTYDSTGPRLAQPMPVPDSATCYLDLALLCLPIPRSLPLVRCYAPGTTVRHRAIGPQYWRWRSRLMEPSYCSSAIGP
eukprot:105924-Rhodomonas_salina.3